MGHRLIFTESAAGKARGGCAYGCRYLVDVLCGSVRTYFAVNTLRETDGTRDNGREHAWTQ
eukprot:4294434-Prymnesium_polylepis.1